MIFKPASLNISLHGVEIEIVRLKISNYCDSAVDSNCRLKPTVMERATKCTDSCRLSDVSISNRRVNKRLTAVECRVARNRVGESNRKSPTENVELLWNGKRFELSIETDRHRTCCEINGQLQAVSIPTDGWIAVMERSWEYSRKKPSRGVQQGIADCWNIELVAGNWLFHRSSI